MDSPTYLIKSRSGEVLIQGTADQVETWVKDRRISDKDELKRLGWAVYEKDEAWAVICAFPEFSGPSAHEALRKMRRQNFWILTSALLFCILGFSLICVNFLLPAYDAGQQIEASEDNARKALTQARQAVEARREFEVTAKAAVAQADEAHARLEAHLKKTAEVQAEKSKLNDRLDQIRKTMPILVRWRESYLNNGRKVFSVTNTSEAPLKLLVSVYDVKGVQTRDQYPLTLAPAGLSDSTKESGVGEVVKHYFMQGEAVEFTDVDAAKDFRFNPIKFPCR
jgi:hypothetical protein